MSFLASLLALVWDQVSPLHRPTQSDRLFRRYAVWLQPRFNAGTLSHAYFAWGVATLLPALAAGLVGYWLGGVYIAGLIWSALVLYQCLGLRQISDLAGAVGEASRAGDVERLQARVADLGIEEIGDAGTEALDRLALRQVFEQSLRRVFGVLFWFVIAGPGGVVLYASTALLVCQWRREDTFQQAVMRVMAWLDWLPARLLVLTFALVGNYEESLARWRGMEGDGAKDDVTLLVHVGTGALGLDEHASAQGAAYAAAVLLKRAVAVWLGVLGLLWLGTL